MKSDSVPAPDSVRPPSGGGLDLGLVAHTPLHRRGFFGLASVGALAGAIKTALPAQAALHVESYLKGNSLMLDTVTHESFLPHVGETFVLDFGAGRKAEVKLTRVNPLARVVGDRRAPFALLFTGEHEGMAQQRIYEVTHAKLGGMKIFLVPIGRTTEGVVWEAIFN
ncbi:MAG TPA: hypothetical protein VMF06_21925 [Candidatus Limnocylindria bacterium]|nr:hypothetical protein [Candidatus Limnocylindria bacterium]